MAELRRHDVVQGAGEFPMVIEAGSLPSPPWSLAPDERARLDRQLLASGAIVFPGLGIDGPAAFDRFVRAVSESPLEYRERSSPRSRVSGNIYTSTDYPPRYGIFLHNENSYSHTWPMKLFFCCQTPAEAGGETPIADCRRILARIDPAIRRRFADRGVLYVRNFGDGLGLPWPAVFQTEDRHEVERYCRRAGIDFEWRDEDGLRTRHVRPAIVHHPRTGEPLWFNHATFFHVSTLEPFMRETLLSCYAEDELPSNTFYGDGRPIEPSVLEELRGIYREETVSRPWQQGDVMLLDNMLAAHGRARYRGQRKVLVAMTEPVSSEGLH